MKLLPALLLAVACAASAEDAYRWVDKDGKVHYSDTPPAEPVKTEQRRLGASVIDSGGNLSYEARQAMRDFPVTLFVAEDCGQACDAARSFLKKRSVPFTEKTIRTAEDTAGYKKAGAKEPVAVPGLAVGDKVLTGFDESSWGSTLEAAGYPLGQ